MSHTYLVEKAISPGLIGKYLSLLSDRKDTGGHSIFLGQVRNDQKDDRRVAAIEYSAYEEMVETEASHIKKVTMGAFSDVRNIEIIHSTGLVKAGEISLFVMVTAGHRDQAIRACSHVVEMIKLNYPVWKKEIFDDNSEEWKDNQG